MGSEMNFSEALEEMKNGAYVTRPTHKEHFYFRIISSPLYDYKEKIVNVFLSNRQFYEYNFDSEDILANDWEVAP